MAFACHLVRLAPALRKTCLGRPELPEHGIPTAMETFKAMRYGDQDELYMFADFAELYLYLRGGKGLRLPSEEWRQLLPRVLPWQVAPGPLETLLA